MHLSRTLPLASLLALCVLQLSGCKAEKPIPLSPDAEISALLIAFQDSGFSLERNGEVIDNAAAGAWLRTKWSRRTADVRSAEDFIKRVAHHSSETKKPYQIVLADGTRVESATWFNARLQELRRRK